MWLVQLFLQIDDKCLELCQVAISQPAFTCSKLIIETVEQGVKYVQS